MSQPPYPPQGGSDAGGEQPQAGTPSQENAGPAYEGPPASGYPPHQPAPQYGQQYGQPQHGGQPQYAQPQYGQQYGQPPYGQPQYGQPQYGQAQYGQPQYGQQPYGAPPPWVQGAGGGSTGPSRKTVVALAVGAVVVVAAIVVAIVVGVRSEDDGSGSSIPEATSEPDGLGNDPELDDYAQGCYDGDMRDCDDLFRYSPGGSAYELYGGTCAGRQSNSAAAEVFCVDAFPPSS